jgi:hypothetical protein
MAAYSGSALNIQWLYGSGTTVLTGDQKTFSYNPSIDLLDQSAGNDSAKSYITALKDGRCAFNGFLQSGSSAGGTIMMANLIEGYSGTLVWSPEGTASTKPKYTQPAISMGAALTMPFAGLVEISCDFQCNGLRVDGTNA